MRGGASACLRRKAQVGTGRTNARTAGGGILVMCFSASKRLPLTLTPLLPSRPRSPSPHPAPAAAQLNTPLLHLGWVRVEEDRVGNLRHAARQTTLLGSTLPARAHIASSNHHPAGNEMAKDDPVYRSDHKTSVGRRTYTPLRAALGLRPSFPSSAQADSLTSMHVALHQRLASPHTPPTPQHSVCVRVVCSYSRF